jgi:DnaJ-domain-containing protein 1
LERLGIDSLEASFGRLSVSEDELLDLKEELEIRTTLRAKGLLDKVNQKLADGQRPKTSPSRAPASASSHKPYERVPVEIPVFVPGPNSANVVVEQPPNKPISPVTATEVKPVVTDASMAMSPEQAFKVLRVSATSSWEEIERSRRDLVARAQPDRLVGVPAEKRRALQDECRMVNTAYKCLLQLKS